MWHPDTTGLPAPANTHVHGLNSSRIPFGAIVIPIHRVTKQESQAMCCGPIQPVRWEYTNASNPTPQLLQKGLTQQLVRQELQGINNKSAEVMSSVKNRMPFMCIPLILIPVGFVLMIAINWIFGVIVVGLGGILFLFVCGRIGKSMQDQLNEKYDVIKQYIIGDLNAKWNRNGIKWSIPQKAIIYKGRRRVTGQRLYHIVCICISICVYNYATHIQTHYVLQVVEPINAQQQQVVVIQQPQPQQIVYVVR